MRGIDGELLGRILPFVTVYSGHAGIDPSVASDALLGLLERGSSVPVASIRMGERSFRLPQGLASPSPRRTYRILATGWTASGGAAALEVIVRLGIGRGAEYSIRRWRQVAIDSVLERPVAELPPC